MIRILRYAVQYYYMDDVRQVLEKLDFSDSEADLYLALLRKGESTASALAGKADVYRRTAYDSLDRLRERGFVSCVEKSGEKIYSPADVNIFLDVVEEKKQELGEVEDRIKGMVPELKKKHGSEKEKEVKVLMGKRAVKRLFYHEVEVGETVHLIGTPLKSEEYLDTFLPKFTRKRKEAEVPIKAVYPREMKGEVGKYPLLEARYIEKEKGTPVSTAVYGDNVGIVLWIEKPLVIMIKSEEVSRSLKNYFDLIWKAAEPE